MADKKHILTYAGLKQYEDELQNLKVVKRTKRPESRATYPRMQSMMQQRMSREILSCGLKNWKSC